jgi:ribosome-binding protein aMBF1 (putative translation factor)
MAKRPKDTIGEVRWITPPLRPGETREDQRRQAEEALLRLVQALARQAAVEDQEDIAAGKEMLRRIAAGEEELIPAEVVNRFLDSSESKIRISSEYRGLSARDLAAKAEISTAYLSQIETGAREGSIDTFKRIAAALGVSIDDLA